MSTWKSELQAAKSNHRVAIIAAEFNNNYVKALTENTVNGLKKGGVDENDIETIHVPGSFELPFAAKNAISSGKFDGIITLGVIIRGETIHFDLIAESCAKGIMQLNLKSKIPVIFGVLACENDVQTQERIPFGVEYAKTCIRMMNLNSDLQT